MLTGFQHLHSFLPYLLLPLLLIGVVLFALRRSQGLEFRPSDKKIALFGLIFSHLQLVLGLVLYFIGDKGFKYTQLENFMQNSALRLYAVEHISIMLLAIIILTIGYSRAKRKSESSAKFKTLSLSYGIALILMLSRIPWSNWLA